MRFKQNSPRHVGGEAAFFGYVSWAVAIALLAPAASSRASDVDVYNPQAAAIELPNIYGLLRRPGDTSGGPLDQNSDSSNAFQAYLDTGTSGIIISQEYTDALGINPELYNGQPVTFSDIAVNGAVQYNISEPLDLRLGRYTVEVISGTLNTADTNAYYNQAYSNVRTQLTIDPVDPLPGEPLNLVGMPALKNKVMVVDARLYNHLQSIDESAQQVHYDSSIESLADFPSDPTAVPLPQIQTWVYNKGDTTNHSATPLFDPGVPQADHVVRMSYSDFSQFTTTTPNSPDIAPPTLAHNPFIGPAPFSTAAPGDPPGITLHRMLSGTSTAASATGSWLFDSGAQLSFMSSAMALSLGVELSFDQDGNPVLTDLNTHAAPAGQFEVALGGAGGNAGTLLGFTVDELDLPTTDGLIKFHNVPIAVLDVTVSDGTTSYTLDGDFGMNLLLPSMDTTAGNTTGGAFDFFSFDEATGLLSLTDSTVVPEPAAMGLLVLAGVLTCRRRRRMPRD